MVNFMIAACWFGVIKRSGFFDVVVLGSHLGLEMWDY